MDFRFVKDFIQKAGPGVGFFFMAYVLKKCLYRIEPGYQSIHFNILSGIGNRVFREGYHFLIPFVEKPIIYDCRMKNHMYLCVCGTKGKSFYYIERFTNCAIEN
jgi:hypothetical protein